MCAGISSCTDVTVKKEREKEKKFRKTFEKMEGFSFVTPVTGLNRPNTGKEDDDDDIYIR
jgi:hypothetical protein